MGLDVTFSRRKNVVCPHCGTVVTHTTEESSSSGGRVWYPLLESIGYYVPYDKRTEENDWYGKDMELTAEQAMEVYKFIRKNDVYDGKEIANLIATAIFENDSVVVTADW